MATADLRPLPASAPVTRFLHRRGTWEPAALIRIDLWVLLAGLIVVASLRGLDYATGNDAGRSNSLSLIEAAAPLEVWAAIVLVSAAVLTVGVLTGAHLAVWLGHMLLSGVYVTLAVGVWLSATSQPWWDGFRSAGDLLLFGVIHFVIGLRTGPRPTPTPPPVGHLGLDATGLDEGLDQAIPRTPPPGGPRP